MNVHFDHPEPGRASIVFDTTGRRLDYRADPITHHVVDTDDAGRAVRAFGGHGRGAGCMDTPLDLVFVRPQFTGEHLPGDADAVWLAVADYGNRRIQVFELDGAVVGEVGLEGTDQAPWPPCALHWRAPVLEVEGVEGRRTSLHLSGALLANVSARGERTRLAPVVGLEARH
jgi:hypothetical protein